MKRNLLSLALLVAVLGFAPSDAAAQTPVISTVSPSTLVAGGGSSQAIAVAGSGFIANATVTWNGVALTTTFSSSTMLFALVPASLTPTPGIAQVKVRQGPLGINESNTVNVTVAGAQTITSLSPTTVPASSPTFVLTVNGTGFDDSMVVQWNGLNLATVFVSDTVLTAEVNENLVIRPTVAAVTVWNASQETSSNAMDFEVTAVPLQISELVPPSVPAGAPACEFRVLGQSFDSFTSTNTTFFFSIDTDIHWGQLALQDTIVVSGRELLYRVPAEMWAKPQTVDITAVKTTSGTQTPTVEISNVLPFTVRDPLAATALNPASVPVNSPAFPLEVTGSSFAANSMVFWNKIPVPTEFVSPTLLRASVPETLLTEPGDVLIQVREQICDGGWAVSNTLPFLVSSLFVTSLQPPGVPAGAPDFDLGVTGGGFNRFTIVRWNGENLPTVFVDTEHLRARVNAARVAQNGIAKVSVFDPERQLESNTVDFAISNLALTSIVPNRLPAGSPTTTLTANGVGFSDSMVVRWNGTPLETMFESGTQLQASIPSLLLQNAGTAKVDVQEANAGVTTNQLDFEVYAFAITSLDPSSIIAGSSGFQLVVHGTGFDQRSVVQWNDESLATVFVSETELRAGVGSDRLVTPTTARVTVRDERTGSSTRASMFEVTATEITSLSPPSIAAGSSDFTLTVNGNGFTSDSIVQWEGVSLTTTFVSDTQLQAAVNSARVEDSGAAVIRVWNPSTGVISNTVDFTITAQLRIISVTPETFTPGSGPVTMSVVGVDLDTTSLVQWNGVSLDTTFVSSTQLTAIVTNNLLQTPGSASVRVWDPERNQISNVLTVTVALPPPPPANFVERQDGSFTPLRTESAPAEELEFDVTFSPPYGLPLDVEATLTFIPASGIDIDQNPTVAFTTSDPGNPARATVAMPAEQAAAGFVDNGMFIATGTVAGEIRVTLRYWVTQDGQRITEVTPNPAPETRIQVQGAAPQVSTACFTRSGSNFQVRVWGFSPTREVTHAIFGFSGSTNLQTTTLRVDAAAAAAFQTWFSNTDSQAFGGSFFYTQPFTISGSANDVTGVSSVIIGSAQGDSTAFTSVSQCP